MKKITIFKTTLFHATVIFATMFVASCETKKEESNEVTEVADEQNDAKFENKKLEKDAEFLVDATAFSLEEIQHARLVRQKSTNADIKELAKMMEEEHGKMLGKISGLAKTKLITIPDSSATVSGEFYNEFKAKAGRDFDKAYCDRVIENHKNAIAKFEKEISDSRDGELKEWSTLTLQDLRKHLDHVFAIQKKHTHLN